MTEIWRDIKGYEGIYQVSNFGNVKRLVGFGCRNERIRKTFKKKKYPYLRVNLCKNNIHQIFSIHRLVAEAFIPNPNNLPEVNHKDENVQNNRVDNLEWCNHLYNCEYSFAKPVNQYTLSGDFVREWDSATTIQKELNIFGSSVNSCCRGKLKSAGGFKWYYVDDYVQYIDQPLW